ncbi:MAG: glycosyltransferase [Chitinophagaceae bacterium]|nr:MAG: glycosyltransferase [Chitinophagaceae bacterium]
MDEALIIFTKNPIHGRVKTRLAATIGNDKALAVYHQLLSYTRTITDKLPFKKFVFYSDWIETGDNWNNSIYIKKSQQGPGLGEKIINAFSEVFYNGYSKVVIIGTDCPGLTSAILSQAFDYLQHYDVVLGPATDGGYYLLGMNKLYPGLLQEISWSTDRVLAQTLQACKKARLSYVLLETLSDIDTEDDLIAIKLLNTWIDD